MPIPGAPGARSGGGDASSSAGGTGTGASADAVAANALLDFSGLPRFADFSPALITPALDTLLAQAREAIARAGDEATPATWEAFVEPLEDVSERLSRAWGLVGHLNGVADTPELRAAYNENLPRVTQFWTEVGQNRALYAKYLALRESGDFAALAPARKRAVELALQAFRLGGVELESPERERFMELAERQAALGQKFSENVLDATDAYGLTIEDVSRLEGVPQDVQHAARERAEADGEKGFKLTLQMPSYLPVMQYANDRSLRETLYRAYSTRASALAAAPEDPDRRAALDNAAIIDELLVLRHEEATLLGYDNFAEVSLVPKMADTPEQVITFLRDLAARARPFAERDVAELRAFAADELGLAALDAWDIAWASEKLKERRYSFSDQEVKQLLPAASRAFRPVRPGRAAVRRADLGGRGADLAPGRSLSPDRTRRRTDRAVLPRPARAQRQASRSVDGRRSLASADVRRRADAGRLSHLQLPGDRSAESRRRSRTTT